MVFVQWPSRNCEVQNFIQGYDKKVSHPLGYHGTERKTRYPDMNSSARPTVSAFPTVAWLQNRSADRAPVLRMESPRLPGRPTATMRLLQTLRPMLQACVRIEERCWVVTPDGELPVDFTLHLNGRKVAFSCRPSWVDADSDQDALTLVYGGYDALYRCAMDDSLEAAVDSAYAIMQALPIWFSSFGRLSLGRRASDCVVQAMLAGNGKGWSVTGKGSRIEALRLHVASDWVLAFERALRGGTDLALSA